MPTRAGRAVALVAGLVVAPAVASAVVPAVVPATRAFADPAPAAPAAPPRTETDCARARKAGKPCQLTIEPEQVDGDRLVPDGTDLRLRQWEPPGSLLRLRRDFIAQIVQSADEL
jgi:hypothetical protein